MNAVGTGQVKKLIKQGGLYVNNARVSDIGAAIMEEHLIGFGSDSTVLLLRSGRKNYFMVHVQN